MVQVSDKEFEDLIGQALDELPKDYVHKLLKDVAVTWQDEPTQEQRAELQLRCYETLYGLYEGLPLPQRYSGYTKITPDKITIFKGPISAGSADMRSLKENIKHTVWHEMAHFFGLDHKRIHELENRTPHERKE
jgi:predicted Zn-dependent protease with MMP-like domain